MKKEYPKFYSVEELKNWYEYTSQGHWFSKDTMRFFKTKLLGDFKQLNKSTYVFITTELDPSGLRLANVRIAKLKRDKSFSGFKLNIDTYGEFNLLNKREAKKVLKNLK